MEVRKLKPEKQAMNIEGARFKLQGLGHDAENVDAIMDNELKSVQGTAFGLDEAATVAASAVAAGIQPGQEIKESKFIMPASAVEITGAFEKIPQPKPVDPVNPTDPKVNPGANVEGKISSDDKDSAKTGDKDMLGLTLLGMLAASIVMMRKKKRD